MYFNFFFVQKLFNFFLTFAIQFLTFRLTFLKFEKKLQVFSKIHFHSMLYMRSWADHGEHPQILRHKKSGCFILKKCLQNMKRFLRKFMKMIDFRRGWDESVKFFLQTPYLGEEPNQLSEHTTIRTIELSIVNDDSALAHDFVDEKPSFRLRTCFVLGGRTKSAVRAHNHSYD